MKETIVRLQEYQKKCGGGRCPKILMNKNGDVLVQGKIVNKKCVQALNIPDDEDVVFLPKDVMEEFMMS